MSGMLSKCGVPVGGSAVVYSNTSGNPASITLQTQALSATNNACISVKIANTAACIQSCSTLQTTVKSLSCLSGFIVDSSCTYRGQLYQECFRPGPSYYSSAGVDYTGNYLTYNSTPQRLDATFCNTAWPANGWPTQDSNFTIGGSACCQAITLLSYSLSAQSAKWGMPIRSSAPSAQAHYNSTQGSIGRTILPVWTCCQTYTTTPAAGGYAIWNAACINALSTENRHLCYISGACFSAAGVVFSSTSGSCQDSFRAAADIWSCTPAMIYSCNDCTFATWYDPLGANASTYPCSVYSQPFTCSYLTGEIYTLGCPCGSMLVSCVGCNTSAGCSVGLAGVHPSQQGMHSVCHGFFIDSTFGASGRYISGVKTIGSAPQYAVISTHPSSSPFSACTSCCGIWSYIGHMFFNWRPNGSDSATYGWPYGCTNCCRMTYGLCLSSGKIQWSTFDPYRCRNVVMIKSTDSAIAGYWQYKPECLCNFLSSCQTCFYCSINLASPPSFFVKLGSFKSDGNIYESTNSRMIAFQLITIPYQVGDTCWVSYSQCFMWNNCTCWDGTMTKFISSDLINWTCAGTTTNVQSTICDSSTGNRYKWATASTSCVYGITDYFNNSTCLPDESTIEYKVSANQFERTGLVISNGDKVFVSDDTSTCVVSQVWGYDQ